MAKTRMLKTDLRTSEKVASWPIEIRYFWVLLWGYVDDWGKGKDNPLLIKADCFPLDPEVTGETVDGWLDFLAEQAVIVRYEVDGVRLLKVINWAEHQKPQHPTPDVLPNPDAPGARLRKPHEGRMKDSGTAHAALTPGFELGLSRGEVRGADATASEPPLFCTIHPSGTPTNCRACADARRAHDKWTRDLTARTAEAEPERRQVKHMPGLCDAHRQPEGSCEMCAREERAREEYDGSVIHGRFGGAA